MSFKLLHWKSKLLRCIDFSVWNKEYSFRKLLNVSAMHVFAFWILYQTMFCVCYSIFHVGYEILETPQQCISNKIPTLHSQCATMSFSITNIFLLSILFHSKNISRSSDISDPDYTISKRVNNLDMTAFACVVEVGEKQPSFSLYFFLLSRV